MYIDLGIKKYYTLSNGTNNILLWCMATQFLVNEALINCYVQFY